MTLFDAHGREIPQPNIHDPQGVSADEAAVLAQMVQEIRAMQADPDGEFLLVLPPFATLQLAGLVQLALRHPGTKPDIRQTGEAVVDAIREHFVNAPATLEVLRRGDDPEQDVRP
jgi:hypothetical protein